MSGIQKFERAERTWLMNSIARIVNVVFGTYLSARTPYSVVG